MCIITIGYKLDENQPLIVVANRDEFENRPAAAAHYWPENHHVFGGKDLEQQGSWLAVHENGRFAAVTNYRDFSLPLTGEQSRGHIVNDFILQEQQSESFLQALQLKKAAYGPFNIVVYDGENLMHYNNITDQIQTLEPGLHCITNATLNTPWPKAERMKQLVQVALQEQQTLVQLIAIGQDVEKPGDARLPETGVGLAMERELSSIFVQREGYGTRCTTVMKMTKEAIEFLEQTYVEGVPTTFVEEKITLI